MTIFYSDISYLNRFWIYFRLKLILITIIYLIFSFVNKTFNPIEFKSVFLIILIFYILYQIVVSYVRTIYFIEKIELISDEFVISYQEKNLKRVFKISKSDIHPEIFLYDTHTRTTNHYLEFQTSVGKKIKQYDYSPWTYDKMKEIQSILRNIDIKANP